MPQDTARDTASGSPPIALWTLALGGVGFACGFFGPMLLQPEANQGPLLGILITGPGGALLGLVLGIAARVAPLSAAQRWKALKAVCVLSGGAILFFCLPGPELRGRIVDAEIVGCEPPAALADDATAEWEARIAKVTWSPPRANWKQDVARMLRDDPGVVLELRVIATRDVYENRKPWNHGTLFAAPWKPSGEAERFFARWAGGRCEAYLGAGRALYVPGSVGTAAWPPDLLPNYLGLQVLDAVPDSYQPFAVR